jgi:hypothetical protein
VQIFGQEREREREKGEEVLFVNPKKCGCGEMDNSMV